MGNNGSIPPNKKKGNTKQKVHAKAKALVLEALEEVGGKDWLVALAKHEPRSFASLITKMIPTEVAAKVESDVVLRLNVNRRLEEDEEKVIESQAADAADSILPMGPETGSDTDAPVDRDRLEEDSAAVRDETTPMLEFHGPVPDPSLGRTEIGTRARRVLQSPDSEFGDPSTPSEGLPDSALSEAVVEPTGSQRPQRAEDPGRNDP